MACIICQEDFASCSKEDLFITTCAHSFHERCWRDYLSYQQSDIICPLCKTHQGSRKEPTARAQEPRIDIIVDVSTISITRFDGLTQTDVPIKPSGCPKLTIIILVLLIAAVVVIPLTVIMMKNTS